MLEFDNVSYSYPTLEAEQAIARAVKDLSFSIGRGEFVAMLGHNGSGKSTVAKLCNGLLAPSSGQVLVNGLCTSKEELLFDIRKQVGMVFQNPDNQIIAAIVEDDVAFGPENLCVPPDEIRQRVDGALKAVGMFEHRLAEPHKLSGGQKQRVAIAGVLAMHNDMIVLDESTAMLDPRGRHEVMETVMRLNKEQGKTVLFITHFMEEALLADRVMVMHRGDLILDGLPTEIFAQREKLAQAGLNLPAAARFAQAAGLSDHVLTEDQVVEAIRNSEFEIRNEPPKASACGNPGEETLQSDAMLAIETKNLTYRYRNTAKSTKSAIEDVNLQVAAGELLCIIGHTGSGKSTLVQHLNALLKPSDGTVVVDGKNIWENKAAIREARFWVGLCFQYPEYQLFEETVEKDIAFGPNNMGLDKEEVARRVRHSIDYVGLDESYLTKSPFDLSGGEKRRVAIAGVMAMEPQALVLDEPTAGLDPRGKEQILGMIQRYREETGRTVILISHNMEEVARMADKILVMHHGKIAFYGGVGEVFSHGEALTEMGLTVPPVTRIFLRLKALGLPVDMGVYTIAQGLEELRRLT